MKVYQPQIVQDLKAFYGDTLLDFAAYASVYEHLDALAKRMWEGFQERNRAIAVEINNYHPSHLGRPIVEVFDLHFSLTDCQHVVANQYGYSDWTLVKQQRQPHNIVFETAVDLLLKGEIQDLEEQLKAYPDLVQERSQFGHQATLLHYTGNNGVELWRQQIPFNLAEGIHLLLQSGADKNVTMKVYGGEFTTWELLKTSTHPHDAGLMEVLSVPFEN